MKATFITDQASRRRTMRLTLRARRLAACFRCRRLGSGGSATVVAAAAAACAARRSDRVGVGSAATAGAESVLVTTGASAGSRSGGGPAGGWVSSGASAAGDSTFAGFDLGGLDLGSVVARGRTVEPQGRVAHHGGIGGHGPKCTGSRSGQSWHNPVAAPIMARSTAISGGTSTASPVPPTTRDRVTEELLCPSERGDHDRRHARVITGGRGGFGGGDGPRPPVADEDLHGADAISIGLEGRAVGGRDLLGTARTVDGAGEGGGISSGLGAESARSTRHRARRRGRRRRWPGRG